VQFGAETPLQTTDYTFAVTGGGTNAGTATVTVTAAAVSNYTGTASGTFAIAKADPVLTTHYTSDVLDTRTYNGSPQAVTVTLDAGFTGLGAATFTYTGTGGTTYGPSATAPTDAGDYAVTATFAAGDNFNAVTTPVSLGTMTITQKSLTLVADDKIIPIGGSEPLYTFRVIGLVGSDTEAVITTAPTMALSASPPFDNTTAGNFIIEISGGATTNTNYTIGGYHNGILEVTNKDIVTITGITVASKTYDGAPVSPAGMVVVTGSGGVVTNYDPLVYSYHNTVTSAASTTPPQIAGDYYLEISTPYSDPNYIGTSAQIPFTISKKTLTVRADDKTITTGDALPTATVSYIGFVGTDNTTNALDVQVVVQLNVSNSNTAGTSVIDFATNAVLNATNGANYILNHVNGTLTISNPPPSGTAPRISGPATMTLQTGYTATSTEAYTITGTSPVTVNKTKGDARIAWNASTRQFDIAEGLPVGVYAVELTASNAAGTVRFTFTLTVDEKVYYMDISNKFTGGTVVANTSNPYLAVEGQTVTLTITPDAGYELVSISVVNYDNHSVIIPLSGTGLTPTFTMPANHITVAAVFRLIGTAVEDMRDNRGLKAYVLNGVLYVSDAAEGAMVRVYNSLGTLISTSPNPLQRGTERSYPPSEGAGGGILLPGRGIYFVTDGKVVLKVSN
jgi:hypothetical protein